MRKNVFVACMVATLIIFATTMLTGCEEITKEATEAEITATNIVKIVVQDSIVHHYDTLPGGIIIIHDSMWFHDSSEYNYILTQVHWRWDGIVSGYLWGTDSVYLKKYDANGLCGNWQTTARHSGIATLNVGTTVYPTSVVGDTLWLSAQGNGLFSGTIAGHYVSLTLGNQVMEATPVIMDSKDWREYLQPHNDAMGQYVVFGDDNVARGRVIGLDGNYAGTVTDNYTTSTPEDTTRRLISADTAYSHLSTNPTGAWTGNTVTWSCYNRQTITRYYNMAPTTETDNLNFNIQFPYTWSSTGAATPSMDGQTVPFISGTATWTGGLSVTLAALPRQCSIMPIPLPCTHGLVTGTVHWNGGSPYVTINGDLEGTTTTTTHTVPATNRHIVSRDTAWNGCGQVYQTWLSASATVLSYYIERTGVETVTYNVGSPLTVTNTVRDTTVYTYTITVNGQGNSTDVNTTTNFSGNTVTFGGLSVTLTPYGIQNWCALTHTTGTLTSTGVNVTGIYNGSSRQTLIPVTFGAMFSEEVLVAVVTDGYKSSTPNLNQGHRVSNLIVIVEKHIGSTIQYWHYHGAWETVNSRADLDSVQINATEANYYVSQIAFGFYPAIVYNHSNPVQFSRGVVKSVYVDNSYWQLTYNTVFPSVAWAYTLSNSAWTLVSNGGRNALRGVMNSTGSLTADSITKQIF